MIDAGIAPEITAVPTGMVIGTLDYLSPEQAMGLPVGPPSDIFSLGGVITFAATGEGPFGEGSVPEVLFRVVNREPDLSRVPEPIRSLVESCLAKAPGSRPTPGELLVELHALGGVELKGTSFEITPFSPLEQLVAPTARWEFDVRPYRAGHQILTLCVSLRIRAERSAAAASGRIAIPILEREIRIRVDVRYGTRRFVANNWQAARSRAITRAPRSGGCLKPVRDRPRVTARPVGAGGRGARRRGGW